MGISLDSMPEVSRDRRVVADSTEPIGIRAGRGATREGRHSTVRRRLKRHAKRGVRTMCCGSWSRTSWSDSRGAGVPGPKGRLGTELVLGTLGSRRVVVVLEDAPGSEHGGPGLAELPSCDSGGVGSVLGWNGVDLCKKEIRIMH